MKQKKVTKVVQRGGQGGPVQDDYTDLIRAASTGDAEALDRLLMRAQDGIPYEEIATALGLSLPAVKVKVHRARLRLAELRGARRKS